MRRCLRIETILRHPPGRASILIPSRRRLPEKELRSRGCLTAPAPPFPVRPEGADARAQTQLGKCPDVALDAQAHLVVGQRRVADRFGQCPPGPPLSLGNALQRRMAEQMSRHLMLRTTGTCQPLTRRRVSQHHLIRAKSAGGVPAAGPPVTSSALRTKGLSNARATVTRRPSAARFRVRRKVRHAPRPHHTGPQGAVSLTGNHPNRLTAAHLVRRKAWRSSQRHPVRRLLDCAGGHRHQAAA